MKNMKKFTEAPIWNADKCAGQAARLISRSYNNGNINTLLEAVFENKAEVTASQMKNLKTQLTQAINHWSEKLRQIS